MGSLNQSMRDLPIEKLAPMGLGPRIHRPAHFLPPDGTTHDAYQPDFDPIGIHRCAVLAQSQGSTLAALWILGTSPRMTN
jgi:hypothetical protein